ncbi:DMT family transporter [Pseudohongiella sp. SYSU M77423]|uniref:DMT family transporter n=1 Tax=unclassified Pseudohongiella TaxID=2629611 RepID=UPI000C8B2FCC|nr:MULTISPECIES: DMT family transporter [unclassified Pseudohongiella]MAO39858.1 EamA family transporter [Pseudohongiella sp.]MDH7942367.1 DMT family transporter [Pseudohongiella sp. SYSU M77423]MEC8859758.1 DMT family transporter [Pseudomonadota bacterium]HBX37387.1 EamA family transporter [Pseudohongiella sp.]|tara:strand:- start:67879 stop:68787 length:909 start_codon:yes stop_codon:yes gene_type:complete
MTLREWFWIVFLGAVWGGSFIFNALLIRELSPLWVTAFRVGIGALGCWLFLMAMRKAVPRDPVLWLKLGLLGVLNYAIPFALFPLAQAQLASGVAAIINALTPIMTVIVSHFWLNGERMTWSKTVGVVAGFSGVAILASPALLADGNSRVWAIGACLLATLCYALALNIVRSFRHVEPTALTSIALTGSAVAAIPVALAADGLPVMVMPSSWAAALAIGLISTAFTFQIMYRLLPLVGATNFSTTTLIAPISAIILGTLFLGETILPSHLLGMAVIFLGLTFIDGRLPRLLRGMFASATQSE